MIKLLREFQGNAEGDVITMSNAEEAEMITRGMAEDAALKDAIDLALDEKRSTTKTTAAANAVAAAGQVNRGIEVIERPVYGDTVRGVGQYAQDLVALAQGHRVPDRLEQHRTMQRAAYGGTYMSDAANLGDDLIPDDFVKQLFMKVHDYGDIYQRCTRLPVAGNNLVLPYVVETDRDTGAGKRHGGVTAAFITPGYEKTESAMKPEKLEIGLQDITVLCPVTDALLEDNAVALGTVLMKLMSEAITYEIEKNVIRSTTGANFDEGLINSLSTIGVGRAAAGAIAWADVVNIYANIHPPLRKNMVWLISPSAEAALLKLESTSGFPVYLGGPAYPTGAAAPPNTLLGKPVFISEHASLLGSTGDIIACNLGEYIIAEKAHGPQMASSIHLRFQYNITTFRLVMRINGEPWWQLPLTLEQGNDTVSWAAYLAAGLTDITTF